MEATYEYLWFYPEMCNVLFLGSRINAFPVYFSLLFLTGAPNEDIVQNHLT